MYTILFKAVEKRKVNYEMVTTDNTPQYLCHAKDGETPQTLGMVQNITTYTLQRPLSS